MTGGSPGTLMSGTTCLHAVNDTPSGRESHSCSRCSSFISEYEREAPPMGRSPPPKHRQQKNVAAISAPHGGRSVVGAMRSSGLVKALSNHPGTVLEVLVYQRPLHREFFDTYRNYGGGLSFRDR